MWGRAGDTRNIYIVRNTADWSFEIFSRNFSFQNLNAGLAVAGGWYVSMSECVYSVCWHRYHWRWTQIAWSKCILNSQKHKVNNRKCWFNAPAFWPMPINFLVVAYSANQYSVIQSNGEVRRGRCRKKERDSQIQRTGSRFLDRIRSNAENDIRIFTILSCAKHILGVSGKDVRSTERYRRYRFITCLAYKLFSQM